MVVLTLVVAVSLGAGAIVFGIARSSGPRRAGETSARVAEMPAARDVLEEETMPVAAATGLGMGVVAAVVVVTGGSLGGGCRSRREAASTAERIRGRS